MTYDDIGLIQTTLCEIESRSIPSTEVEIKGRKLDFPLIGSPMDTVVDGKMAAHLDKAGMVGIIHNLNTPSQQSVEIVKYLEECDRLEIEPNNVGIALPVQDFEERLRLLTLVPDAWICFDAANGFTTLMEKAITKYKEFGLDNILISGNVDTYQGAKFLDNLGVDLIRVGIGGGSVCETSLVTGFGRGMLTSLSDIRYNKQGYAPPKAKLIADGGIKKGADIAKALAFGASFVMVGSLLAGHEESPGETRYGKKVFRGMASRGVALQKNKLKGEDKQIIPEGIEVEIPYKGPVAPLLEDLKGWLRVAMTYANAKTLDRFNPLWDKLTEDDKKERFTHIQNDKS